MPRIFYKGQGKLLCPYYEYENERSIKCSGEFVRFTSSDVKTEFRNHHCLFANPRGCEIFDKHKERVLAGEEEKAKPRQNYNDWWNSYYREYMRDWMRKYRARKKEEKLHNDM